MSLHACTTSAITHWVICPGLCIFYHICSNTNKCPALSLLGWTFPSGLRNACFLVVCSLFELCLVQFILLYYAYSQAIPGSPWESQLSISCIALELTWFTRRILRCIFFLFFLTGNLGVLNCSIFLGILFIYLQIFCPWGFYLHALGL